MNEKPYLLLDVDGVINAWPTPPAVEGHLHIEVDGWPIWYNTAIIQRLNDLADRVEMRWLTTWREKAREHLAPAVGLPDFDVVPHDIKTPDRQRGLATWWKHDALDDLLTGNDRRAIWCDDDLDKYIRKCARSHYDRDRLLMITPHTTPGLTHEHLDRIEAFIDTTETTELNMHNARHQGGTDVNEEMSA